MNVPTIIAIVAAFLMFRFVTTATRLQRNAVMLGFVFPGLGHWHLGEKKRGLILGGVVVATFLVGMWLADFRNISLDRHPIWSMAHVFGGGMSLIAAVSTWGLEIRDDNVLYQVGCLYSGVATLANILVMIDAFDCAFRKDASRQVHASEEIA